MTNKEIIKQFDKYFTRDDGLIDKYSWYGTDENDACPQTTPEAIKVFILKALSDQEKEIIEKIEKRRDKIVLLKGESEQFVKIALSKGLKEEKNRDSFIYDTGRKFGKCAGFTEILKIIKE